MSKNKEVRKDILRQLREGTNNENIKLPSALKFLRKEGACVISMSSDLVTANLQTDGAAFEGWALATKRWLGEEEPDVEIHLHWEPPEEAGEKAKRHYERFLYRVIRFTEIADWFKVGDRCETFLEASSVLERDGNEWIARKSLFINAPSERNDDDASKEEIKVEKYFCDQENNLLEQIGWRGELERQIPMGIFRDEVRGDDKHRVFPGHKAAIDLIAFDRNKAGDIALFELKRLDAGGRRRSPMIGALSEVLFYSHVVRDIGKGYFFYEPGDEKDENIKDLLAANKTVYGYILAERIHPLLDDDEVFTLLNSSFDETGKRFGFISYDESLKCRRIYPH